MTTFRASNADNPGRWARRDTLAAVALFVAAAGLIVWRNGRVLVLWDFSYILDTAWRIACGQRPYRDFPLSHAPVTFLIQALLIRLGGRHFWLTTAWCALGGGSSALLAWRIALRSLRERLRQPWWAALLLAAPLPVLGLYCILPHPGYDCDAAFAVLLALFLLQRALAGEQRRALALAGGAALALPVFCKQNIGLPFLAAALLLLLAMLADRLLGRRSESAPAGKAVAWALAGALLLAAFGLLALQLWVGLGNYTHWTIAFARSRRMPGLEAMAGVYAQPALLWMLPATLLGLWLARRSAGRARLASLPLLAAPWLWTLAAQWMATDADARTEALLALWPLALILAWALLAVRLLQRKWRDALLPLLALAAIHGTLLSQQLWGSTYSLWPQLVILCAELLGAAFEARPRQSRQALALAAVLSLTLAVSGALYVASEARLSYIDIPAGPARRSQSPALRTAATPGPYLADFDELLAFAQANIPPDDTLILLPGEDPFYYASGRTPRFPVLLFDPATDPYSPEQLAAAARESRARWVIVKRRQQIQADPTPELEAAHAALLRDYVLYRRLRAYAIYKR